MANINIFLEEGEEISEIEEGLIKAIQTKEEVSHKERFIPEVLNNLESFLFKRFDEKLGSMMKEIFSILKEDGLEETIKSNPKGNIQEGHHNFNRRDGVSNDYTYVYNKNPVDYIKEGNPKKKKDSKQEESVETSNQNLTESSQNIEEDLKDFYFNYAMGKKAGVDIKYFIKLKENQVDKLQEIGNKNYISPKIFEKFYMILFPKEVELEEIDFLEIDGDWAITKQGGHYILFLANPDKEISDLFQNEFKAIGQDSSKNNLTVENNSKSELARKNLDIFCDGNGVAIL